MYKINPLKRDVLLTVDEVIFHAPTKHTLDPRTIEQSIIIAEERFAVQLLGYAFYNQLAIEKNKKVTDGNINEFQGKVIGVNIRNDDTINASEFLSAPHKKLWDHILWKYLAECVMITATPEAFVQFGSEGVIHTNPQSSPMVQGNIVTPELRSVKWVMDKKMWDRIDPLKAAVHNYLCANKGSYPYYNAPCDCDVDGNPYKRRTNFVLGIYDDSDCDCNCR